MGWVVSWLSTAGIKFWPCLNLIYYRSDIMGWFLYCKFIWYIPGPSILGPKWFRYRVSIHHPLASKDGTLWKVLYMNVPKKLFNISPSLSHFKKKHPPSTHCFFTSKKHERWNFWSFLLHLHVCFSCSRMKCDNTLLDPQKNSVEVSNNWATLDIMGGIFFFDNVGIVCGESYGMFQWFFSGLVKYMIVGISKLKGKVCRFSLFKLFKTTVVVVVVGQTWVS